jgi:chromosome segregation ATPase
VEQLSLLRESNSALREENAGNLREAARWRAHSSELEAAVGALKASLQDKEAAAEGAAKERDIAQQEANRWKARAEQVKRGRSTWAGRDVGAARVDLHRGWQHTHKVHPPIASMGGRCRSLGTVSENDYQHVLTRSERFLVKLRNCWSFR